MPKLPEYFPGLILQFTKATSTLELSSDDLNLGSNEIILALSSVMRPMTDLCFVCQQNSTAIVRSANLAEEDKKEVCHN